MSAFNHEDRTKKLQESCDGNQHRPTYKCVCVFVIVCARVFMCIHTSLYVCVCVCFCVCVWLSVYRINCVCVCVYVCVYLCVCGCVCVSECLSDFGVVVWFPRNEGIMLFIASSFHLSYTKGGK